MSKTLKLNRDRIRVPPTAPALGTPELFGGRTLSEIASDIARETASWEFALVEARAFGAGSDCDGLISDGAQKRLLEILAEAGLTIERYNELMAERTSDHYMFYRGGEAEARILRRQYPEL